METNEGFTFPTGYDTIVPFSSLCSGMPYDTRLQDQNRPSCQFRRRSREGNPDFVINDEQFFSQVVGLDYASHFLY